MDQKPSSFPLKLIVNEHEIEAVLVGRHYLKNHSHYMNDDLILELVMALDGGTFPADSTTNGVVYYAADVTHETATSGKKIYRLIWLFEGDRLEILGVIHAYRRKKKAKG